MENSIKTQEMYKKRTGKNIILFIFNEKGSDSVRFIELNTDGETIRDAKGSIHQRDKMIQKNPEDFKYSLLMGSENFKNAEKLRSDMIRSGEEMKKSIELSKQKEDIFKTLEKKSKIEKPDDVLIDFGNIIVEVENPNRKPIENVAKINKEPSVSKPQRKHSPSSPSFG